MTQNNTEKNIPKAACRNYEAGDLEFIKEYLFTKENNYMNIIRSPLDLCGYSIKTLVKNLFIDIKHDMHTPDHMDHALDSMLSHDLINMLSHFGADFSRLHGFDIKDLILGEYSMSAESVINTLQYAGVNFGAIKPWDLVELINKKGASIIKDLTEAKANFGAIKPSDLLDLINKKGASIIKDLTEAKANFGAIEPWDLGKLIISLSVYNQTEESYKCTDVIELLSYTNAKFEEMIDYRVEKLIKECGINVVESLESVGVKINDKIVEEWSNKKINEIFSTQDADYTIGASDAHLVEGFNEPSPEMIVAHYC